MHGVVFNQLKEFVETEYGADHWDTIADEAGGSKSYMPINTYPDEELLALVEAATEVTGATQSEVLTAFGKFAGPTLVDKYDAFLDDEWDAIDILEHTEDAMHKAVRLKEEGAEPPELECERPADERVIIEYASEYQLCQLGEGLILGIADAFDEQVEVTQTRCMLENDLACSIQVDQL